jgi:hypothetical protein
MALKRPRLNNMNASFQRRDLLYETIMTDLYLLGLMPKEVVEGLTGHEVSEFVKLPDAVQLRANEDA